MARSEHGDVGSLGTGTGQLRVQIPFFKRLKREIRAALGIKKKRKYPALPAIQPFSLKRLAPEDIFIETQTERPKISVLMADDGEILPTLNALASIAEHPPRGSIEILIATRDSSGPRFATLGRVKGVKLIETAGDPGMAAQLNALAGGAAGDMLCILRNGAAPLSGAIDAMVDLAEKTPEAGLIGAHPLNPEATQQNAGAILWSDASFSPLGPNDDPMKPEYQYVRDADIFPGACLLVPRSLWREFAGFDENFAHAPYAELDFALRLRAVGKRNLFQPDACFFHFAKTGDESATGQSDSVAIFASRWGEFLRKDGLPRQADVARVRDGARERKVLLVIDQTPPEPDKDAGSRTMIEFIRSFQSLGWMVKFWPQNLNYSANYMKPLQQMGVEIVYGPYETELAEWLDSNGGEIDAALLCRPTVTPAFLGDIRSKTSAPALYYGHDLHFARYRLEAEVTGKASSLAMAEALEKNEAEIWRNVDFVLYPTQDEVDAVLEREPGVAAGAVPAYCFEDLEQRQAAPPGKSILFVGGFGHSPNIDAAVWFVKKIFPLIRRAHPDSRLSLVGSQPKPEVLQLAGDGVKVVGWVSEEELKACYAAARVAVVPLRFGAGIKLKTVEALAAGAPLATTAVGAQGLQGLAGICSVEDDPEKFAAAVIRLLAASDSEWLAASRRQIDYLGARFHRRRQIEALRAALETAEKVYRSRPVRAFNGKFVELPGI